MELKDKSTAASDDEDDLEKLRLAALQSLKRTVPDETNNIPKNVNKHTQNLHKRRNFQGRNPRNGQFYSRQKNTNLISIPTVSDESLGSDLKNHNKNKFCDETVHKLILPQDRYCNIKTLTDKPTEPCSKFDRYDNSDKSESESECDNNFDSETESPGKLEKASSLEALMQELENEIQGESKPKEEKNSKPNKSKKRKQKVSVSETTKENDSKEIKVENTTENVETNTLGKDLSVELKSGEKESVLDIKQNLSKTKLNTDSKKSPINKKFYKRYHQDRNIHNPTGFLPHQSYAPPVLYPENIHFNQNLPFNQVMPYNNNVILDQTLLPLNVPPLSYTHPPITTTAYDRPPSPLSLNTDDVLTITRAPLSPRSAAFVLQNREIIERRKKSPRRSYSRSPSPRYRRSKSPASYGRGNRSPSPRKFMKSKSRSPYPSTSDVSRKLSPCKDKLEPIRDKRTPPMQERRSPLPRIVSPLRDRRSPPRTRVSPHRQRYPERRSPNSRRTSPIDRSPKANYRNSPKGSVRERLGNRTSRPNTNTDQNQAQKTRKRSRSLSLSPEPDENKEKIVKNEKDVAIDPILEARRKKFETKEIKTTEGIIRLKPKAEDGPENLNVNPPELPITSKNEDITPEESELMELLNTKVDDIFSDEETDEENEGRFKSNLNKTQRNVSILPFTQLLDDSTKNVKTDLLKTTNQSARNSERNRSSTDRARKRQRSRTPLRNKDQRNYKDRNKDTDAKVDHSSRKTSAKEKLYAKNRILFRNGSTSRKEKLPMTAPIENKKIEIKIRNPSKYETISKYDVANEYETLERLEKIVRKVEVSEVKKESDVETSDAEITNENEETFEENADVHLNQKSEASGDLRAQLSRKRAERQSKLPVPEDVQSRLLQNALQGAVFKKPKKSRKEKDSAPKELAAVKRTATVTNLGYGIMKIKSNKFLPGERKVRFLYSDTETIGNFPDGKLPIHLRLGFANNMDIFQEKNTKRKRSKSKGRIDQV